jgi:hypothetical protein
VVGFMSAWRLALLSVAVIPGIAFAGGLYAYTLTGLTSKSRESYANAGIIAEQVKIDSLLKLKKQHVHENLVRYMKSNTNNFSFFENMFSGKLFNPFNF